MKKTVWQAMVKCKFDHVALSLNLFIFLIVTSNSVVRKLKKIIFEVLKKKIIFEVFFKNRRRGAATDLPPI